MEQPPATSQPVMEQPPAARRQPVLLMKTIQGNAVRTLFEVLKEIVHDVSLFVDASGVRLLTLDGARCALVHMRLRADAFEEFRCEGEFNLGINMSSMFKLVKTSGSHDTITLYVDEPSSNELGIKIQNAEKNSVTDFQLKLLDVDDEIISMEDKEFDSVITMPSTFFQRICRDMLNIADTMIIKSSGDKLVLSCNGDFAKQVRVSSTPPPPTTTATRRPTRRPDACAGCLLLTAAEDGHRRGGRRHERVDKVG